MATSILIIEDETAIADVLQYALQSEGFSCHHCTLGQQGIEQLQQQQHALVILDVGLPDISGFDVCREIRRFCNVPILFLTARSDEIDRVVGLELGADDYVSKPFSPREVVARVRAILRRLTPCDNEAGQQYWFELDDATARIRFCNSLLELTRYEYLLLKYLLDHPEHVFSRAALMDAIWADALDTSDRTVDTHIKTLRAKLKVVRADIDAITTHRGLGYSIRNESCE